MQFDLTDTWHGRFAYPRRYDPVSFVAEITQSGAWLSGTVEEPAVREAAAAKVLTATLTGRCAGTTVTFLKTYDTQAGRYRTVQYEGTVADQGLEIVGTWTIPGSWSGTFIMIRSRGLPKALAMRMKERV